MELNWFTVRQCTKIAALSFWLMRQTLFTIMSRGGVTKQLLLSTRREWGPCPLWIGSSKWKFCMVRWYLLSVYTVKIAFDIYPLSVHNLIALHLTQSGKVIASNIWVVGSIHALVYFLSRKTNFVHVFCGEMLQNPWNRIWCNLIKECKKSSG